MKKIEPTDFKVTVLSSWKIVTCKTFFKTVRYSASTPQNIFTVLESQFLLFSFFSHWCMKDVYPHILYILYVYTGCIYRMYILYNLRKKHISGKVIKQYVLSMIQCNQTLKPLYVIIILGITCRNHQFSIFRFKWNACNCQFSLNHLHSWWLMATINITSKPV